MRLAERGGDVPEPWVRAAADGEQDAARRRGPGVARIDPDRGLRADLAEAPAAVRLNAGDERAGDEIGPRVLELRPDGELGGPRDRNDQGGRYQVIPLRY